MSQDKTTGFNAREREAEIANLTAEVARLRDAVQRAHGEIVSLGMLDPDGALERIRLILARAWHGEPAT